MRIHAPLLLATAALAVVAPLYGQAPSLRVATEIAAATPRHAGDTRHIVPPHDEGGVELLINVPQRMLFLLRGGAVARALPVAVGRVGWQTPIGPFRVLTMETHPYWDVPLSIQDEMRRNGQEVIERMDPGPKNPLGNYWIGLSIPGLGIHGTPAPSSIYHFATHGCIRLHPDDVEALFGDVAVGTRGEIIYEPVLLARRADGLFIEVHRDVYGRGRPGIAEIRSAVGDEAGRAVDWTAVAAALRDRDGLVHRIAPAPEVTP